MDASQNRTKIALWVYMGGAHYFTNVGAKPWNPSSKQLHNHSVIVRLNRETT
jgi:hypothetical protein